MIQKVKVFANIYGIFEDTAGLTAHNLLGYEMWKGHLCASIYLKKSVLRTLVANPGGVGL